MQLVMPHLLLASELQLLHEPLLALLLLGRRLQPRLQRFAVDAGKSCEQLMPVQQQQARQQPTEPADAGAPAMPSVAGAKSACRNRNGSRHEQNMRALIEGSCC